MRVGEGSCDAMVDERGDIDWSSVAVAGEVGTPPGPPRGEAMTTISLLI